MQKMSQKLYKLIPVESAPCIKLLFSVKYFGG